MGRLDGKVAIVTGGARGQGEAEVRLFAAEGAKVVVSDVLVDEGRAVADSLGDGAVFLRHDVSREEDWEAAVNLATERFGGLDVLVNNAGILHNATIAKHTLEAYERVVAVNQVGVFLGIRSAIAPMTSRGGGSIVNISSGAGLRATKYCFAYSATKYAVTGMTACARAGARPLRDPGQLDPSGPDRHPDGRHRRSRRQQAARPGHADAPVGRARGDRPGRAVPGQRRGVVHDRRPRPRRRRRHRLIAGP